MIIPEFPKTTDILPKHDLVFGSPINDPLAGIPLGDGDTGSLFWLEADAIHININKTDLWDESPMDTEYSSFLQEDEMTCLRHGGELVIKFDSPCFDMIYQKDFEERLSLTDATLKLNAKTPFSGLEAECFASAAKKVTSLRCHYSSPEENTPSITLSRWGSRTYMYWYLQTKPDPEIGLDDTETFTENNRIYIKQKLKGTEFCIGIAVISDDISANKINSHSGQIKLPPKTKNEFTLFWNISLGETAEIAYQKVKVALDEAINIGYDNLHKEHSEDWKKFWNKSFINIPHDYIENCWYLSLYYSNSSCRGKYPPLFTNGIWGFRHDFSPWAFYFHYNMQHMYGPLEAAGHGFLADNYYKMRRNGLDAAYLYANEVKKSQGCFYTDVFNFKSKGVIGGDHNCTVASQIAMSMYRHWRITGDSDFLYNTALPVMKGAAEFYLGILKKEEDGFYHIDGTAPYEGNPVYKDTLTDLAMIRVLFESLINYAETKEKTLYEEILNNLPPYTLVPFESDEVNDGILLHGIGKGEKISGDGKVFSVGKDIDGNPVRKNYGNPDRMAYGFPDIEMAPIYPAGVFGLKDKGTEEFDAMINQILLHGEPEKCMQWCMMPIYMARMGMAEKLYDYLEKDISTWLLYPNGLGVDCPAGITDLKDRLKYNSVKNIYTEETNLNEAYGFRHFDMETLPIIALAVNESLLQSYDGILRICPAVKKEDDISFCLYAEGGFKVWADKCSDGISVVIESLRGEPCKVCMPDNLNSIKVYIKDGDGSAIREISPSWEQNTAESYLVLTDELRSGEIAIIIDKDLNSVKHHKKSDQNKNWKTCGNTHLGTPPVAKGE